MNDHSAITRHHQQAPDSLAARPKCLNCGKPLPLYQFYKEIADADAGARILSPYGYQGDGKFCTLRCGYRCAVKFVTVANA